MRKPRQVACELAYDPFLECTGKEWGVGRHRRHRIGGVVRPSGAWGVEFEVHVVKVMMSCEDGS